MKNSILICLCLFAFSGCGKEAPPLPPKIHPKSRILRVAVFADGRLTVNGENSTLPELRESLKSLKKQNGVVMYYRERGDEEPPPVSMEVMQAVINEQLPIQLTTRRDFSNSVGPNRHSNPK